jgi:peptidyl-tRNA hydrolase, PTH2 family
MTDRLKQIIVIRRDLKSRRGKEIAQGAHAAVEATLACMVERPELYGPWQADGCAKICVTVPDEATFHQLAKDARAAGLLVRTILDQGVTEYGGVHTYTALAIGPDYASRLDPITGHLTLY